MSRARVLPAVDQLLGLPVVLALAAIHGIRRVRLILDEELARLRASLLADSDEVETREAATALVLERLQATVARAAVPPLQRVLNATGVIIHTNLGRAPLAIEALKAMREVGDGYSCLEFDLATGRRGSRHAHLDGMLREATGAEAGVVANNTAAVLTLALAALASGREVILSRGELVEIGGGFRVPEILRGSGAVLREVGTTNRTRVADYAAAISDRTAAILRVHPSNFRMEGFTERPALADLAALAHRFALPLIEDVGSGWLGFDLFADEAFPAETRAALGREPAVRDSIRAGASLVAFSVDKLLGCPQAGLLVGRANLVARVRQHPLMRAMRADKTTYAGLDATLRAFTSGRATAAIPVMRMLAMHVHDIATRADLLATRLRAAGVPCEVVPGASTIGGGSLPGETLPTRLVRIDVEAPNRLLSCLRHGRPAIVGRIADDRVCLDLRTVPAADDAPFAAAVIDALSRHRASHA